MGFFINEPVSFGLYGITATDAYVTIRGKYTHEKIVTNADNVLVTTYNVMADYEVFVDNVLGLHPIQTGTAVVVEDVPVVDAIEKIYAKIKLDFPGKTFTDDV